MTKYKSDFLRSLDARGFIHQITDAAALDEAASKGVITAYIGFDATADSLHVGNLVGIMLLRRLQQAGHKPVVLMGGGTTKVGDPSGKEETRQLLTDEQIAANIASIKTIFQNYLRFDNSPTGAVMVNNADWLDPLLYIPFLREVGKHFTINRMLTFDSVKMRLEREQPLTFLEFNYMIMQGYDFVELFRRMKCTLQMGGSDQWGNIVNGTELGRKLANAQLHGLTAPLITTSSGAKMGKTVAGAVWLKAARLSPYDYWQFWRNTEDADVGRFLKLFTDLPLEEIARLEKLPGNEINEAKKVLAFEATRLCHGEKAANDAAETARRTFEEGGAGDNLPTITLSRAELKSLSITDLLVKAGLAASKGEARRLIEAGGAKVNGGAVSNASENLAESAFSEGSAKLSAGKKRHAVVKLS
ncbi:MAG TPA: tyrosine--tRNA ligase [Alphaproteobacteria bacterium]|nr:tyrosine--tRNA ligase [Alphaproteobacteria bacterium]